jgi:hypothetical protein
MAPPGYPKMVSMPSSNKQRNTASAPVMCVLALAGTGSKVAAACEISIDGLFFWG